MDWWLILLVFIIIVLIVWWLLSRQSEVETPVEFVEEVEPADMEDLTRIEGIGPKVKGLLNNAGVMTFAQLADKSEDQLKEILDSAGPIYKAMDKASWPKQSKLAAAGKWEELEKLQEELIGGK